MSDSLVKNEEQLGLALQALSTIEKTEQLPEKTPMDQVEHSIASFLEKAIDATVASNSLARALEDSFVDDIQSGNMTTTEKITLYNIQKQADNDRMFKLISPTFGVIVERQRAEIQAANQKNQQASVQVNVGTNSMDAQIASQVPAEVSLGLESLFQLMNARAQSLLKEGSESKEK